MAGNRTLEDQFRNVSSLLMDITDELDAPDVDIQWVEQLALRARNKLDDAITHIKKDTANA